jgi:prolipoprotein diacylglyceryltransferase
MGSGLWDRWVPVLAPPPEPLQGAVVFSLCVLMGFQRLCFEFFRYNERSEVWFRAGDQIISVYQGVAALLMPVGIMGLVWRARISA